MTLRTFKNIFINKHKFDWTTQLSLNNHYAKKRLLHLAFFLKKKKKVSKLFVAKTKDRDKIDAD